MQYDSGEKLIVTYYKISLFVLYAKKKLLSDNYIIVVL